MKTPDWSPAFAWWLEQGGRFALPDLRGGGEYGEKWHEAGMFEHKQNVFDEFYCGRRLPHQRTGTLRLEHFAITGRSNGGLIMGAAMTQQPQTVFAVVCGYPLLDMLRYQKFEKGAYWTTEYGSSDNPGQFPYLLKDPPYQNVREGDGLSGCAVLHRLE